MHHSPRGMQVDSACAVTKYIKIPTGPQAMDIVRGVEERWDFLQCFGTIDESHILIIAPRQSHKLLQL